MICVYFRHRHRFTISITLIRNELCRFLISARLNIIGRHHESLLTTSFSSMTTINPLESSMDLCVFMHILKYPGILSLMLMCTNSTHKHYNVITWFYSFYVFEAFYSVRKLRVGLFVWALQVIGLCGIGLTCLPACRLVCLRVRLTCQLPLVWTLQLPLCWEPPPFYGFLPFLLHNIFDLLEKNVRKLFPSRTFSAAFTARHCPYKCPGKSGGYWKFESACCAQKDFGVGSMRMGTMLKIFIHLFCFVFGLGF